MLFRALLGFGAVAPCPNVVMDSRSPSLQDMRLNHIANDGATISAHPDSPILPLPSQLFRETQPAPKQLSQDDAVQESEGCSEPAVEGKGKLGVGSSVDIEGGKLHSGE